MSEDTNQTTLEDFLNEVKEQEGESRAFGSGEFEDRTTLKAERNTLYRNYIVEGYTSDVQSKFGKNTAIRLTSPEGEKQTLWVAGYEEQHFNAFVKRCESEGNELPLKISFARTQQTAAKSGNTYNKLNIKLEDAGEDVQIELDNL
tara:strand:+ start:15629 stop:16066 length:438 start_codon:yes stop_codon:yes gene_type:complete